MKPVIMWAVACDKFICHWTISRLRREAIRKAERDYPEGAPFSRWKNWVKKGYRVVKVEVREVGDA